MKRVVTGVNEQGRSYVVSVEQIETTGFQTLWEYEPSHAREWIDAIDPGSAADWLGPQTSGGMRWLFVPLPPAAETEGVEHPPMQGIDENGFHTTRTVDLDFVVEGEVVLVLDEESIRLQQGDCVVQQATRHAWKNDSDAMALLVAVLYRPDGV